MRLNAGCILGTQRICKRAFRSISPCLYYFFYGRGIWSHSLRNFPPFVSFLYCTTRRDTTRDTDHTRKKIRQERHSHTSPSKYSRRGIIGSPFTLYLSQNYTDFAKAAGSRSGPAVMKEASKAWNELSLSEKHPYIEIRKAERIQRKQE